MKLLILTGVSGSEMDVYHYLQEAGRYTLPKDLSLKTCYVDTIYFQDYLMISFLDQLIMEMNVFGYTKEGCTWAESCISSHG